MAITAFAVFVPGADPGHASPQRRSAAAGSVEAGNLADRISAYYTRSQEADGSFPDYVTDRLGPVGRNTYGPGMIGGALVLNGVRKGRQKTIRAGLRSIDYALKTRSGLDRVVALAAGAGRRRTFEYPFSLLPMIEAWHALEPAGRPGTAGVPIRRHGPIRRRMSREIAWLRPIPRIADPNRWSQGQNRILLERLAWAEVLAARIRPPRTGRTPVLRRRVVTRAGISRFMSWWLDGRPAWKSAGDDGNADRLLVSDSPDWPLAYHALSSALLARMIAFSPRAQRARLGTALRAAVQTSGLLVAPDGDLAYSGRSTLQPWTLSTAAYAALVAARLPGVPSAEANADRALGRALIARLADSYVTNDGRVMLTPSMLSDPARGIDALDSYAAEVSYAGLTLLGLEWAARESDRLTGAAPPLNEVWGRQGPASFFALRAAGLWTVLKGTRGAEADRRSDLGPIAAKQVKTSGEWEWVIPPRPGGAVAGPGSWLALDTSNGALPPVTPTVARTRIEGRFALQTIVFPDPSGQAGTTEIGFTYSEASCGGLSIGFAAISDRLEMNLWLPGNDLVTDEVGVSAGGVRVEPSRQAEITVFEAVPGPANPDLTPVTLTFGPSLQPTGVSLCLMS
jgi:hypothetical protein